MKIWIHSLAGLSALFFAAQSHAGFIDYFKEEDGSTNWQYIANFSSSVLILLLLITTIFLFFNMRRAYKANKELKLIRNSLEVRVKERTEALEGEVSEHKETAALLRSSEAYIKSILDSMPLMLIGLNDDLEVTQWNTQAEKTTGVAIDKAMGKNLWDAYPTITVSPEKVREVLKKGESTTIKLSQRGQYYFDITLYPLVDQPETGIVIMVDDVTQQSKAANLLIQRDKFSAMGELASAMAHDISLPLRAIEKAIGSVKASLEAPEAEKDNSQLLLQQLDGGLEDSRQASAIIKHLIEFANSESEKKLACGGGGGGGNSLNNSGGSGGSQASDWVSGVFHAASEFKDFCESPRSGSEFDDLSGSTLDENNWLRSWTNETYLCEAGETHSFTIQSQDGSGTREVELISEVVTSTPVLALEILPTDSGDVGYLLFNDHIATAEQQLIDAINTLSDNAVSDLILDLRYNGGGLLAIASQMAYMIAGATATNGQTFELSTFNDQHPVFNPVTGNEIVPFPFFDEALGFSATSGDALPSLNLDRVFVLATGNTCSASEAIINGLLGIDVEVILIGDTTCGKPYGFYPTDNCGTTYFSIQFRGENAKGFGDYAEGFAPASLNATGPVSVTGCAVDDDFSRALGEENEAMLAKALEYRATGSCESAVTFSPDTAISQKATLPTPKNPDATRILAEQGDPHAQYLLGYLYEQGEGVYQSDLRAVFWYRQAAEQGSASAQVNLGYMYAEGRGVEEDQQQAAYWYHLAAEQGSAHAQNNLGNMYLRGIGVEEDDAEAINWYLLAASQGIVDAQHNLALMYHRGIGTDKNDAEAIRWFKELAKYGDPSAQGNLGAIFINGQPEIIDHLQGYAWLYLAVDGGNETASRHLEVLSSEMSPGDIKRAEDLANQCLQSAYLECDLARH
eukprot:g4388.t1